ncbi:hypothetical protein [Nocardia sp. NPDC052566]|uniref:hypothetical protein n=1 Tax=Nocardia sp. NPDC052566 TaxID=3364330 RepID=UPI0037C92CC2
MTGETPSVRVGFGAPTDKFALHYVHFYAEKPFLDTDLYLYDNGTYWITSDGEDHYGVYVVTDGAIGAARYTLRFISLPSPDWGDTVAYHELEFDSARGEFTQLAYSATDPDIPAQDGTFVLEPNTVADPTRAPGRQPG